MKNVLIFTFIIFLNSIACLGQEALLSDTDPGYKYVEETQEAFCSSSDSSLCSMTVEDFLNGYIRRELARTGHMPPDSLLSRVSKRVSTKYEIPSFYNDMKDRYDMVKSAANRLGYKVNRPVKLGSLPIREVNASTLVEEEETEFYTIFINYDFFIFTYEMTKLIANTLPLQRKEIKTSPADMAKYFNEFITENPGAPGEFASVLLAFLYDTDFKPPILEEGSRKITSYYIEAMELFAISHEYGHIYLKHTTSQSKLHFSNTADVKPCGEQKGSDEKEWQQEVAADLIAFNIIKQIYQERKDNDLLYVALLAAPEFYFLTRQTMDELQATVEGCSPNSMPEGERNAIEKIKSCFGKPIPEMERVIKGVASKEFSNRHPHPVFRAFLARDLMPLVYDTEIKEDISRICSMLNMNLAFMWIITKPRLERTIKVMKSKNIPIFTPR